MVEVALIVVVFTTSEADADIVDVVALPDFVWKMVVVDAGRVVVSVVVESALFTIVVV